MELQPNLMKYNNELKTIEQPHQISVNGIFETLSVRDKAILDVYTKDMNHRDILNNIRSNSDYALKREIKINKENYDMIVNGPALCVTTDLNIFWHLLNRKKTKDEISIQEFCKELEITNDRDNKAHKMIIESFYRLSNNIINLATDNMTLNFQLVSYKKENDIIKYSFNEDFLTLLNSKNGLERHDIVILNYLNLGLSKMFYTLLTKNRYSKSGIREFKYDELVDILKIKNKRKDRVKDNIKKALTELKENNIISDFNMKLDDITIYASNYEEIKQSIKNKEEQEKLAADKRQEEKEDREKVAPKPKINNEIFSEEEKAQIAKTMRDEILHVEVTDINSCLQNI